MMHLNIVRFVVCLIVCLAMIHAYPPSMSKTRWLPPRIARQHAVHDGRVDDYNNVVDGNDNDLNDSNGFATWLFRSRKFCCAPPL
ncbi:unnamed protein product [Adineta ricciae]|uniref:Secreted protein n=1 Tax=Adineta ricciae TaxID=249248 RepID=A0A814SZ06_ADIRI|nr:unnamed protein product [Adineta ricciae]